jgi:hypothetical protein
VSAKAACIIPRRWTLEDYARHTCGDRSHGHLSRVELADNLKHGLVEIVRHEDRRLRHKTVVRIVRTLAARGLSCSVGSFLVMALSDRCERGWALAMLAQIRMRREARVE